MNSKKISITIDDLPFVSPGVTLDEIEEATSRIHSHLEKNKIQTVGFAVGEYVSWETQGNRRLDILKAGRIKDICSGVIHFHIFHSAKFL